MPSIDITDTELSEGPAGTIGESTAPAKGAVKPRRKWGQWIVVAILVYLLAWFVERLVHNEGMNWSVVGEYFTHETVVNGLWLTLWLTLVCSFIGYVLGTLLATMQLSSNVALRVISGGYIWIFRSIPQMVQLLLWFNIAAILPQFSLGIPFGPSFFHMSAQGLINGISAAIIGLSLSEAAYAAEIVRAGIMSVDAGQREAAEALGMGRGRTFLRIVLPQAMRGILPPLGNSVIGMLKTTSLVSVIAVHDILYTVEIIYNRNFQVIPLLMVACIWYLVVTTILTIIQSVIERYYGRGYQRSSGGTGFVAKLRSLAR